MKLFNQQDSIDSENSRKSTRFSKNSKERESKRDSRHNRFLYWFTQQMGYVQSLTHSKDFTKMINLIKFTTLAHNKNTLHSAAPLLNLQQTKKPHRVHCVFQELPCGNPHQVIVIQNPLYNLETSHCTPQQTIAEPTTEQETTQKPTVCFKNTLVETHNKSQPVQSPLYRTELPTQVTHNRITFNTVKELSQSQQYKHLYTKDYKSNKERVQKAQSDDQISEETVSIKSKLQQQFKKTVLDENID